MIRIAGGLGNQMFQYAAGKALAARLGAETKLDTSWFDQAMDSKAPRSYALWRFGLHDPIAAPAEVERFKGDRRVVRLSRLFFGKDVRPRYRRIDSRETLAASASPGRLSGLYLDGYWQSEDYFSDHMDAVHRYFSVAEATTNDGRLEEIRRVDSVALHVRRGDYESNPAIKARYSVCSPAYYESAVAVLEKRIDGAKFFVFSDDPDWAKANLRMPSNTEYVSSGISDNDGFADFCLMRSCSHFVISNSTFSWWAAWLRENPDKIICAPDPWFRDGKDDGGIVPRGWIKIRARA